MKTPAFAAAALCALFSPSFSEDKQPLPTRVSEFIATHRTPESIGEAFKEWSAREPENPDPYVLAANAYLAAADNVVINADTKRKGFAIVDPKTKKQVGTLGTEPDPKIQRKGEEMLAMAAAKFPHRLDIHVGRMSVCERIGDSAALERAITEMLAAVAAHGEKLRWVDDAPIKDPLEEKVVGELNGRIGRLYGKETPETDEAGHRIAVAALKLYPKNVKLLNFAAVYHAYKEQWKEARELFLRASEIAPDDLIVLSNIAMASLRLGDTQDAKQRFEAIVKKAPDSDEAKQAKGELAKLKKAAPKKP